MSEASRPAGTALIRRVGRAKGRSTRRKLLLAAGASIALGWSRATLAQGMMPAGKLLRVGFLFTDDPKTEQARNRVFVEAMRDLGWVEGRNIMYDRANADGDYARLPMLAAKLVGSKADLIFVGATQEVRAALTATTTTPIVFSATNDPVASGLVKSLARPGGNVTGIANIGPELGPKRLQLIREALPRASRVGLLISPVIAPLQMERKLIEEAADRHIKVIPAVVNEGGDIEAAFKALTESRAEAVLTTHIGLLFRLRRMIFDIAMRNRLPVIGHRSLFADSGALMAYSSNLDEQIRRSAHLVDKVLRGAKPADIPVEQPTKFELVINLKTARALAITIPQAFLLRADRVIE
ncbi:MAG: ABC transporter substrate-binding protein [Betaproteobacteria bacterium]